MGKITINEIHNSLFDYVQTVSDNKLETNNKTIVGAINELFSDNSNDIEINNLKNEISNGKKLIADAIGEPLVSTDTFSAMSNGINNLNSQFKSALMNNGISVKSTDKFKQLIEKIALLADSEDKGIQYAEGNVNLNLVISDNFDNYIVFDTEFKPTVGFIEILGFTADQNIVSYSTGLLGSDLNTSEETEIQTAFSVGTILKNYTSKFFSYMNITDNGLTLYHRLYKAGGNLSNPVAQLKWYAIGVGEEDTTLRDSLASILQDEGVEVTPEDDMASLIIKTDNEFQENTTILYNKMKDANYNVDSSMNMDALLNELTFKTIIEGKVTQSPSTSENSLVYSVSGLDFTPSLVYVTLGGVYEQSDEIESVYYKSIILNNRQSFVGASEYNTIKVNIKNNGFNLILNSQDGGTYTGLGWTSINGISYVAIR